MLTLHAHSSYRTSKVENFQHWARANIKVLTMPLGLSALYFNLGILVMAFMRKNVLAQIAG